MVYIICLYIWIIIIIFICIIHNWVKTPLFYFFLFFCILPIIWIKSTYNLLVYTAWFCFFVMYCDIFFFLRIYVLWFSDYRNTRSPIKSGSKQTLNRKQERFSFFWNLNKRVVWCCIMMTKYTNYMCLITVW